MPMEQRPYQQRGSEFLRQAGRAILADEPGLGKSNQLLLAAEGRTLVVSPAALRDVWISDHPDDPGEAQKWRPDLVEEGNLVWTSYHGLRHHWVKTKVDDKGVERFVAKMPTEDLAEDLRERWDTVIFDECHNLKERKTTWTLAAEKLKADRVYLATGTILPNWAHEIFTTLKFLYPEEAVPRRKFGSYWRWVEEWFRVTPNRHHAKARDVGTLLPGFTWEQFASEGCWLGGRWLRREAEAVLPDLPPVTVQAVRLPLHPQQGAVYRRLKRDLYARIEETGTELVSWSAGGVYAKLMQLATGLEMVDPEYKGRSNKLSILVELMANRTRPTIIFTMFRSTAERTAAEMRQMGFKTGVVSGAYTSANRRQTVQDFKLGKTDVLVGTVATMAEGFNLIRADCVIFIERDPRPSKNDQARRRIRRFGQEHPCQVIDLISTGTVDSTMVSLLAIKTDQQMAALRAFDLLQEVD